MLGLIKRIIAKDDVFLDSGHGAFVKELKHYPDVEKNLIVLQEEQLFELAYSVLADAILNLRNLSYGEDFK